MLLIKKWFHLDFFYQQLQNIQILLIMKNIIKEIIVVIMITIIQNLVTLENNIYIFLFFHKFQQKLKLNYILDSKWNIAVKTNKSIIIIILIN